MTDLPYPRLFLLADAALLAALPVAWFAPLMTVKVTLQFWAEGTDLSVISTLQGVWGSDPVLALLLTFFAVLAPVVKVLGLALVHLGLLSPRVEPALFLIGRLAMADVFLIAVYVALFKGLDGGRISIGWGMWLFTACVLGSLALSLVTERLRR